MQLPMLVLLFLTSVVTDIRGKHVFYFRIEPAQPRFRIEYVGDRDNHPSEIRCYRSARAAKPFQVIDISDFEAPYRGVSSYVTSTDMNRDGYGDLRVLAFWGATGNELFTTYLWNPATSRFEESKEFDACGRSGPDKNGCCTNFSNAGKGGRAFVRTVSCLEGGHLVTIRRTTQEWDNRDRCFHRTVESRVEGKMVVTSRKQVDCGSE